MKKSPSHKIIDALKTKPMTRPQLGKVTGIKKPLMSRHIAMMLESGNVSQSTQYCECCGHRLSVLKFERDLEKPVKLPRAKPKPRVVAPVVKMPTKISLPQYDGSVFGLMTAQLGV